MQWCWWLLLVVACGGSSETVAKVDATRSSITVDPTSATVGTPVGVTVELRAEDDTPADGVELVLVASGLGNELAQPSATDDDGRAAATWSSTVADAKTIHAVLADGTIVGPANATFTPGPAAQLAFTAQPAGAIAGGPLEPITVAVLDAYGNRVTAATPVISLELGNNPASATLNGSATTPAVMGEANLDDLRIDVAGDGYTLTAESPGLTQAETSPFDVEYGPPGESGSSLTASPHSIDADGVALTNVQLHVENEYGIEIPGYAAQLEVSGTGNILVAPASSTDATGDLAATLASTVAEPKTLSVDLDGFTLSANVEFFAPACTPWLPRRPATLFDGRQTASVITDVDHDGEVDVVAALATPARLVVHRGRGDGRFHPAITTPLAGEVSSLTAADVNMDGRMDVVAAPTTTSALTVLLGTGTGTFATPIDLPLSSPARDVAIADLDHDGTPDLVAALVRNLNETKVVVLGGDGTGAFPSPLATIEPAGEPLSIAIADFNVDGHADIGVSISGSPYTTYLGVGDGTFGAGLVNTLARAGRLLVIDVNADTTPDFIVNAGTDYDVFLGDRNGTFTYASSGSLLAGGAVVTSVTRAKDVNGDGHVDLIIGADQTRILFGDGTGAFTEAKRYATGIGGGMELVDVDHDGISDIVAVGGGASMIRGLGLGDFEAAPVTLGLRGFLYETAADFNNDGTLDLAEWSTDFTSRALLTSATGAFVPQPTVGTAGQASVADAADLDEDGDQDLVVLESGSQILDISLGRGDGQFDVVSKLSLGEYTDHVRLADLDGDSHADLVVQRKERVRVAWGNGDGTFSAFSTQTFPLESRDVIAADLDGDGDRDLAVRSPTSFSIARNLGNRMFSSGVRYDVAVADAHSLAAMTVTDLDEDGRLDIALASDELVLYGQQPDGTFKHTASYPIRGVELYQLVARDIDGTGTIDIVVDAAQGLWIFQGFGNGDMRPPLYYDFGNHGGYTLGPTMVAGDRNGDQRVDLAFTSSGDLAVALQQACVVEAP